MILIGFVIFIQVCAAEASGSDPSGIVGSCAGSSNTDDDGGDTSLNPSAAGCFEFMGFLLVLIGVVWGLTYYYRTSWSEELAKEGHVEAALIINPGKPIDEKFRIANAKIEIDNAQKNGVDIGEIANDVTGNNKGESFDFE